MTTTTEAAPAETGHWLTKYDPDDGEPYGAGCDCSIGKDHDGNGDPDNPDDEPDETTPGTDIGTDIGTDNPSAGIDAEPASATLAELIAQQLRSTQVVDGQVIRFETTVEDDGRYIALDVTRVEFEAEADTTARVLLHLSEPVVAVAAESGAEVGASA